MKNISHFVFVLLVTISCKPNRRASPETQSPPQQKHYSVPLDKVNELELLFEKTEKNFAETTQEIPVGILSSFRDDGENRNFQVCTTSILSSGHLITNAHCILTEDGKVFAPDHIQAYFRNFSMGLTTKVLIKKILFHNLKKGGLSDSEDMAILEVADSRDLADFSRIELYQGKFQLADVKSNIQASALVYCPPETLNSPFVLKQLSISFMTKVLYSFLRQKLDEENTGVLALLRDRETDYRDLDNSFLKFVTESRFFPSHAEPLIVSGNSGAPIIYKGKLFGLITNTLKADMINSDDYLIKQGVNTSAQWNLGVERHISE